jgi:uncharacterized protein (DUF302 family)
MIRFWTFAVAVAMIGSASLMYYASASEPRLVDGLITKPSAHSVDATLDRLEAALKERGFMIFARLDHAAAAAAVGLQMPRETVLVFGNPRIGTPNFLKYPTLAIDLPIKALVWQDASGQVWLSYNSQKYLATAVYTRHGVTLDQPLADRIERQFEEIADAVTKE